MIWTRLLHLEVLELVMLEHSNTELLQMNVVVTSLYKQSAG